ncbi:MAG: hypothetical protein QXM96_00300 [Candidatus Woesearchaeota archaeon]
MTKTSGVKTTLKTSDYLIIGGVVLGASLISLFVHQKFIAPRIKVKLPTTTTAVPTK